jgi:t-SNARE complex subunit (syntaxin)
MESDNIQIPKLNSNNYSSWKIHMKLFLISKDRDQTIRKDTRSAEELSAPSATKKRQEENAQRKALAYIEMKVEEEFLGVIEDSNENARTAWEKFEEMFHSVTNARKRMLRQQLSSLQMEPGESAAKYISRVKDLKRELKHAGLDANDVDLAAVSGLSRDF